MNKKIIGYILIVIIILLISAKPIIKITKDSKTINENKTTILNSEKDFLNWFKDFEKLYNIKKINIDYSLSVKHFEKLNNFLNGNNENEVTFKNNAYYIDNDKLELDPYTRSLRYTKYDNNENIEIMEIKLKNGLYYVQLVNAKNMYKIYFNKKNMSIKDYNSNNNVIIKKSIFKNNETWD